jgi:hypothetical protein
MPVKKPAKTTRKAKAPESVETDTLPFEPVDEDDAA